VLAVVPVVNRAALDTQREAKTLAPVDTGRLRASIRPRFYSQGLAADVYTDVEYAPFVEFGTRKMAAQPFLHPAWEQVRPRYMRELAIALKMLAKV
jgi:HK97 gp10 family phage protein